MSERTPGGVRQIERWSPPKVDGPALGRRRDERATPAGGAAAAAIQQAEAAGYAAGLARGQGEVQARLAELTARIERFDALLRQLAHPLRVLDTEVEQSLLTLAVAIASHLTRRTLRAEPEQLIPIVRECLQQLPLGAREVRVRLHPDDAAVVREKLAAPAGEGAWQLVEDPMLTRGGCLIDSEHSRLDARLESRINALIAHALGDERGAARGPPAAGADPAP